MGRPDSAAHVGAWLDALGPPLSTRRWLLDDAALGAPKAQSHVSGRKHEALSIVALPEKLAHVMLRPSNSTKSNVVSSLAICNTTDGCGAPMADALSSTGEPSSMLNWTPSTIVSATTKRPWYDW